MDTSKLRKLVTHPGKGHSDDLLSTCILLAHIGPVPVERREATGDDLKDPATLVYDTGGRHEPDLHNYDHHQLPAEATTCALSLILEDLGLREKALKYWPWLEATEVLDTQGPAGLGRLLGVDFDTQARPLLSPVEDFVLQWWRQTPELQPEDQLHELLTKIGQELLGSLTAIETRVALLRDTTEFVDLWLEEGGPAKMAWISLVRDESPAMFLNHFWKLTGEPLISVCEDERGEGTTIFSHDTKRVDLNKLRGNPKVKFITSAGYLAVTHAPLTETETIRMLEAARTGAKT